MKILPPGNYPLYGSDALMNCVYYDVHADCNSCMYIEFLVHLVCLNKEKIVYKGRCIVIRHGLECNSVPTFSRGGPG